MSPRALKPCHADVPDGPGSATLACVLAKGHAGDHSAYPKKLKDRRHVANADGTRPLCGADMGSDITLVPAAMAGPRSKVCIDCRGKIPLIEREEDKWYRRARVLLDGLDELRTFVRISLPKNVKAADSIVEQIDEIKRKAK